MGYGSNWRKIVSGLESTERILTFDQRGHGRSMKPLTGYASEDYADDLFLITQELGWDQFILVGHSMGGRNALIFAHKFPEKVQKLIIEDIGPDANVGAIDRYKRMLDSVPTPFATKLEAKQFFMNEFPKLGFGDENAQTIGQYLHSNIEEKPDGTSDWRFSKDAIMATVIQGRAKEAWDELRTLTMPTLIIRGENSKELSPDVFKRMIVANPRIKGVEIANAGHWVHFDQPQEFLRIIKEFADF
ncbi:MAG: hydrolase [Oligoflexia bacterium]|nr:MAG: hydrolase [Oligoflexia bacterium]